MKIPLILLVTAIMLAGCSTASLDLESANNSIRDGREGQTQENYLKSVQEEIQANLDINDTALKGLNIDLCKEHSDQELQTTCEYQVIMTMSAMGDTSQCKLLQDGPEKDDCLQ